MRLWPEVAAADEEVEEAPDRPSRLQPCLRRLHPLQRHSPKQKQRLLQRQRQQRLDPGLPRRSRSLARRMGMEMQRRRASSQKRPQQLLRPQLRPRLPLPQVALLLQSPLALLPLLTATFALTVSACAIHRTCPRVASSCTTSALQTSAMAASAVGAVSVVGAAAEEGVTAAVAAVGEEEEELPQPWRTRSRTRRRPSGVTIDLTTW